MTNYQYLKASLPITNVTPKNSYINDFQQNLYAEFADASDVWDIEEEPILGSETYQPTTVRINHVIDSDTGEKRGDDFKKILFKELDHPSQPGRQYRFNDNIWLTYNTEAIKSQEKKKQVYVLYK